MTNRYFILPLPNDHSKIWDIVVQAENTVRKNLVENKMIVKLYKGDVEDHPMLNGFLELDVLEARILMSTPEWSEPDPLI